MANKTDAEIREIAGTAANEAVAGVRNEFKQMLDDIKGSEKVAAARVDAMLRGKVTGPGYNEEFSDWKNAEKEYDKLKKKMTKSSTPGVLKLFVEEPGNGRGKWKQLAKWNANEDAFE